MRIVKAKSELVLVEEDLVRAQKQLCARAENDFVSCDEAQTRGVQGA